MSRIESDYYAHMGFDPEHNKDVRSHYLPFFEHAEPVLEVACGRGEFLSLLAERGISCEGVDRDEGMTAIARAAGHQVTLGDAGEYLHQAAPESFGGVFCAHVLEHMQPDEVGQLIDGVVRVLRPGGVFVAVVPNPACYAVLTHDFWCDPTHVRFYDLPLIAFLCERAGLTVTGMGPNPRDRPGAPPGFEVDLDLPGDDLAVRIEEILSGSSLEDRPLALLVRELNRRLTATQQSLRELESGHRALVRGLYESNEIYVAAMK
jgi:SAM-dependent methyltransferase